jgi:Arc/MetJ-type ribon-helix-helix transcriptional regulator
MEFHLTLAPALGRFVEQQVKSELYANASEVVSEALRILAARRESRPATPDAPAEDATRHVGRESELADPWDVFAAPTDMVRELGGKSAAIRYLAGTKMGTSEIARRIGVRYQFARNVMKAPDSDITFKAVQLERRGILQRHKRASDGQVLWLAPENQVQPELPAFDGGTRPNPSTDLTTATKEFIRRRYSEVFGNGP